MGSRNIAGCCHIFPYSVRRWLVVFLWNTNLAIFKLVPSWAAFARSCIDASHSPPSFIMTVHITRHSQSLLAWKSLTGISFLTFQALETP
jgi:hypothetical protein